jgi:hypothetical protein
VQATWTLRSRSPFELARVPTVLELEREGPVRYLMVNGRQDDGVWGAVGAVWLSADGRRGGFLVHPWALWEGAEFVRGYRSALERGWSPGAIYDYWHGEVWPGTHAVEDERSCETLAILNELISSL